MHKKNPFIFTIKFDSRDPQDCETVRILNEKGRGMAKYISAAVAAYQMQGQPSARDLSDYRRVEEMVVAVINQRMRGDGSVFEEDYGNNTSGDDKHKRCLREEMELSESEFSGIMDSLDFFRE